MPLEEEIIYYLYFGFIFVIGLALIVIIRLYLVNRNRAYTWFLAQFFLLALSFLKFIRLIRPKYDELGSMVSEGNSSSLGLIGILWALSMACMIGGICELSEYNKK